MIKEKEELLYLLSHRIDSTLDVEEQCKIITETKRLFDDICNNIFTDFQDIMEEICKNEITRDNMLHLSAAWLRILDYQYENNFYDGRNKYCVCVANSITTWDVVKQFKESYAAGFDNEQIEKAMHFITITPRFMITNHLSVWKMIAIGISKDHRTIQQTFSKFVFLFMEKEVEFIKDLKERRILSTYWWECPLV